MKEQITQWCLDNMRLIIVRCITFCASHKMPAQNQKKIKKIYIFVIKMLTQMYPQGQKAKQEIGQAKKDTGPAKKDMGQAARGAAGVGVGEDKPKTTRAERRAKQEAERAAKEAGVPKVSCHMPLQSVLP